ncbi:U6 snRNA-associated Sm-like protein LSm7-like protein [Neocallimastix lanati (nom. inval.)]|uniref:U6 snRNA-associated Sm-like protein LSm7 n=1 Tax=Neocallimastix californiae TaxID=1754190 RepID=A0A1Y2B2A0_9FUNG|nr:U6 snRNA-associated Sm-like protein LSm7-like protein [Neocallimastix sp. JGI-2020a]ORY28680.1 U6 snRNA-associated Sm-like protein LSm7 [Neocallimastix californiae]|eukprot:ORY28680.1 U6 snRNA-associated Sm-like protein LSm7 [Neocallimastix californiae]
MDKNGRGGNNNKNRGKNQNQDRPKTKENILDLSRYIDKRVRVKFNGKREVTGILKGFDQLLNIVLDNTKEFLRDEELNITDETRDLGLVVLRGTAIMTVSPDELVEISNPFVK